MNERMVQVPLSFIRSLHAEPAISAYNQAVLRALLSQPAPSTERQVPTVDEPQSKHDKLVSDLAAMGQQMFSTHAEVWRSTDEQR